MEKYLYGIIIGVVVMIIGFTLYPTLTNALAAANLSTEQAYLGTLAKTLYVLGISLVSVTIIVLSVKNVKG